MNTIELKYMTLEYSEKDLEYINEILSYIEEETESIVSFFGITEFGDKPKVILHSNLEELRSIYIKENQRGDKEVKCPDWLCGFAKNNVVNTLCLEEYRKTKSHENENLNSLMHLILHEFTHTVDHKRFPSHKGYMWLGEGIACVLSHQVDDYKPVENFDIPIEKLMYGHISYNYYSTMTKYALDNYGKEYVLRLLSDFEFLAAETPKLYEEIKENYKKKTY